MQNRCFFCVCCFAWGARGACEKCKTLCPYRVGDFAPLDPSPFDFLANVDEARQQVVAYSADLFLMLLDAFWFRELIQNAKIGKLVNVFLPSFPLVQRVALNCLLIWPARCQTGGAKSV